jgi:hypothetical protein
MSDISASTRVHIIFIHDDRRWYLNRTETVRNPKGDLYLKGYWNDDPAQSTAHSYEIANLVRERFKRENGLTTRIALQAGDSAELIQE